MSIFLLILKIIGITLLVVLGLIFLIALLILFVPFVYNIELVAPSKDLNEFSVRFKLSFLFFISFIGNYTKKDSFNAYLRILFLKFKLGCKEKAKDKEPVQNSTNNDSSITINSKHIKPEEHSNKSKEIKIETKTKENVKVKEKEQQEKNKAQKKAKKKEKKQTNGNGFKKIKEELLFYYKMLKNERNKKAFGFVFDKIKRIARHYGPRKIKGHAAFGFSDPANTGYLTGIISMFPVVYNKRFDITPKFDVDETFIDIDIKAKGHVVTFYLLWYTILILTNKNIKRMIKKYKAHKNAK